MARHHAIVALAPVGAAAHAPLVDAADVVPMPVPLVVPALQTMPDGPLGDAIPPLWGPQSFNDGAGMSHVATAAALIQAKMPLGRGGSLSDQDAFDIAALVTGAPRPAFAGKAGDYRAGGRPASPR